MAVTRMGLGEKRRVRERGAELSDASNSNGGGKETVIAECPSENGNSEGGAG